MTGSLFVWNPVSIRTRKKGANRTMARRRRRRMSKKQAKYFGRRRHRRHVVRAATNRVRRRRSRRFRRNPVAAFRGNPVRRRRHSRRFRRNPIGLPSINSIVSGTLVPAAIGAGGAIAVDYLGNMLPLPASLTSSPTMATLTKIGLALLVGWGVGQVAGQKSGGEAAAGAVVVTLYGWAYDNLLQGGALFGGSGMARYVNGMGFIRRNMAAAGPGVGPFPLRPGLGTTPHVRTKFRIPRGAGGNGMGYMNPARTLARYAQQ